MKDLSKYWYQSYYQKIHWILTVLGFGWGTTTDGEIVLACSLLLGDLFISSVLAVNGFVGWKSELTCNNICTCILLASYATCLLTQESNGVKI